MRDIRILPKRDVILGRTYRPCERLDFQLRQLYKMETMLSITKGRLLGASDSLTDKQLSKIADAVESAYNALSNAAHLGESWYEARSVKKITWEEK